MTEMPQATQMSPHANGDSAEYWKAIAGKRLIFQKCSCCGAVQFPPRHHCARCWEAGPGWIEATGRGVIESYTIVRRAPLPQFRDKVPYVVASVITEEGPRMLAGLTGENALGVAVGDAVRVVFGTGADGSPLPEFELA
ncbi:Zn-ribbon domain-containing OB-fold protein [Mangrovicoccus ximenensis]|uniref:Zn-ribbon domain-containing OB-fold protein n=1 Tax=Mangrovicoccus ximenensis TaxID=1911570 RepID=UPI001F4253A0|nr:Zn-ribbon domain-containing OB-fold protein [Mangrovicoccus ximenensis]